MHQLAAGDDFPALILVRIVYARDPPSKATSRAFSFLAWLELHLATRLSLFLPRWSVRSGFPARWRPECRGRTGKRRS